MIKKIIKNIVELQEFANFIAKFVSPGVVILLNGELGAGKTTFAKFIICNLAQEEINVTSPTFNIVNVYDTKIGKIWHYDLYRVEDISELYELSFEDAFNDISIIEWPNIAQSYTKGENIISINISFGKGDERIIEYIYKHIS